jgi:heat shock protein HtpX
VLSSSFTYRITSEVPPSYYEKLLDFFYTEYLLAQKQRFNEIIRETTDQTDKLTYFVIDANRKRVLYVEVKSGTPFELKITPLESSVSQTNIEEAKQDVLIAMRIFSQNARNATVFFAWREGEEIVPEAYTKPEKSFNRLFLETQVLFFIVFIVFGMTVFITISVIAPAILWVAPLIMIAIQFVFVFFSNNFIARTADWHITQSNPIIHFLEYYLPINEKNDFSKTYPKATLIAIKKEIYNEIIAQKGEVDIQMAQKIFLKYGVPCDLQNLKAKKINVYEMVQSVATRFNLPMPKVVVTNTMVPNAAASGPSPSRGIVLITTGLLVQLEENEILSVIGHEFGHLRGRDPLILYGLVSSEFLFRFYVLFPLFPMIFSSFLFFAYFWAVMVLIFFIAKFFEARADIVSAMVIGNPQVLAGSLEKIGYQRLLYERTPSFRLQEWLGLDPHPPIYFRVDRLQKLSPKKIKHPLIQSIKDVIKGFTDTFSRRSFF